MYFGVILSLRVEKEQFMFKEPPSKIDLLEKLGAHVKCKSTSLSISLRHEYLLKCLGKGSVSRGLKLLVFENEKKIEEYLKTVEKTY
jgi:hypothetical protein